MDKTEYLNLEHLLFVFKYKLLNIYYKMNKRKNTKIKKKLYNYYKKLIKIYTYLNIIPYNYIKIFVSKKII